jgi:acetamidase/formamidase
MSLAMPASGGGHTIHAGHRHFGWDNSIAPVMHCAPGDTIRFDCLDAGNGHYTTRSTAADIATMNPDEINPVTGPVYVDGAEPGDALKVAIRDFAPSGFGWTAIIPGFGLLADQFADPYLHLWSYDPTGGEPAMFGRYARVPVRPFAGTIGVAPAEPGRHAIIPPRSVGGNMDIRDLTAGVVLTLPVEAPGALFSIGDTHAAQGDGEVCGTAIESPMAATLTLDVVKGAAPPMPRFTTPGPVTRHVDHAGYEVTTGIGPDLMSAARAGVSGMIDIITTTTGMSPEDAYMLCSVCGDLRISEAVDAPNWVVAFYFPRGVFD